jgi:hypothetical protein
MNLDEIKNIPDIHDKAINYVFENDMVSDSSGLWLEFGVYDARTIDRISKYTDKPIIFGFDSFEGLPSDWYGRTDGNFKAGTFSLNGNLPRVDSHVTLIKGWFSDTLPKFIKEHDMPISFIHVDSDIYSSAKDIFDNLKQNIINGCIIVFDELLAYPGFEMHEWKALSEFVEDNNIEFEWIGSNQSKSVPNNSVRQSNGKRLFDGERTGFGSRDAVSPAWENAAIKITNNPICKFK